MIEDDFAAGRPAWERAGAQLAQSVAPYEEAKIRLLNASHSCLAWAGTLAGYRFIHEGAADPEIRGFAFDFMTQDAIPALGVSPIDLPVYRDTVLTRFGHGAILDTNQRVAADSFAKIPGFIAPTIRARLAAGQGIEASALLPALFLACLQRWRRGTLPYRYQDQAMNPDEAHAICASADPIAALASGRALWADLADDPRLAAALRRASRQVDVFQKGRAAS